MLLKPYTKHETVQVPYIERKCIMDTIEEYNKVHKTKYIHTSIEIWKAIEEGSSFLKSMFIEERYKITPVSGINANEIIFIL